MEDKDIGKNDGLVLQIPRGWGCQEKRGQGKWVPKGWLRTEDQGSVTKKAGEVTRHRKQLPKGRT